LVSRSTEVILEGRRSTSRVPISPRLHSRRNQKVPSESNISVITDRTKPPHMPPDSLFSISQFLDILERTNVTKLIATEYDRSDEQLYLDLTDRNEFIQLLPLILSDSKYFRAFNIQKYLQEKEKLSHIESSIDKIRHKINVEMKIRDPSEPILTSSPNANDHFEAAANLRSSSRNITALSLGFIPFKFRIMDKNNPINRN
jgi:hypothetical protein